MRRPLVLVAAALLVLGASACGGSEEAKPLPETVEGTVPAATGETETAKTEETTTAEEGAGDAAAGKQVFASAGCGGCHTLADAGTNGTIGPNLDDASPSFDKVVERVTEGKGAMPSFKDQLSEEEIRNVAAYVSSVAGK